VDLHSFLLNYQAGHRTVTELISTEHIRTRQHISAEVESLRSGQHANKAEIQSSAKHIQNHVSKTVGDSMATTIAIFRKDLSDLHLGEGPRKHRDRVLKSLKYPGMNERRQHIAGSFPKTFRWVFGNGKEDDDDEDGTDTSSDRDNNVGVTLRKYQLATGGGVRDTPWNSFGDWLRSDSQVYWISGKPGSGKSTLVKYLLSDARTRLCLDAWNSGTVLLSHFF